MDGAGGLGGGLRHWRLDGRRHRHQQPVGPATTRAPWTAYPTGPNGAHRAAARLTRREARQWGRSPEGPSSPFGTRGRGFKSHRPDPPGHMPSLTFRIERPRTGLRVERGRGWSPGRVSSLMPNPTQSDGSDGEALVRCGTSRIRSAPTRRERRARWHPSGALARSPLECLPGLGLKEGADSVDDKVAGPAAAGTSTVGAAPRSPPPEHDGRYRRPLLAPIGTDDQGCAWSRIARSCWAAQLDPRDRGQRPLSSSDVVGPSRRLGRVSTGHRCQ